MKIIYVELFFINSQLKEIKLNTIRKLKNKLYLDCVFKIEYQNEFLQDILIHLIKKANLEKTPLLINYIYDNISFLKLNLPKMKNAQMVKNIDTEIEQLIHNYKELYETVINKISSYKFNEYRLILFPKKENKLYLNQACLKEVKVHKVKEINNFQIIETIFKSFRYKANALYSVVIFNNHNIECYILQNGLVIELYIIEIDHYIIDEYNKSYKYSDLLNVNNQYVKQKCSLINEYGSSRNIEGCVLIFISKYNDYLKTFIDQEINISHVIKDYDDVFLKAVEDIYNEK